MYVTLNDGTVKCITSEIDVADIVETYCGSELAEVIRECKYTEILEELNKENNLLCTIIDEMNLPRLDLNTCEQIFDVSNMLYNMQGY